MSPIPKTEHNARSAPLNRIPPRACRRLGINGITLHTYRYACAERAKRCGDRESAWAQEALGHNSKAIHRAYARKAHVVIPTPEDYEKC